MREVKNSGRLEDKDSSAMAICGSGWFGFGDVDVYGARCIGGTGGGGNDSGHANES